jgi:predicted ABC-type sugar transport system permease subunit
MVVNGFSLVSTSMPYFFVALGLLGALRGFPCDGNGVLGNETTSREIQKG